jgi:tetratricopeptide (TPR) repeat protein
VGWFEELVAEADSVAQEGQHEDAVALLEEALTLSRASNDVAPTAVIRALASWAYQLLTLGLWQRALTACDELLALASELRDGRTRRFAAWALLEKAGALSELEQDEASLAELKLLFDRYGAARNQTIRRYISVGLEREAAAYRRLGATVQELGALQQLTRRFGRSTDPDIERRVSLALHRQAWLLDEPGSEAKALVRYRAFVERVEGTADAPLFDRMVSASVRWARLLARRGATLEALTVLEGALARLESAGETDTENWANVMLARSRVLWDVQRGVEAVVVLDALTDRLEAAGGFEVRKLVASALFEKAGFLAAMGYQTQAESVLAQLDGDFAEPALAALDERIAELTGTTDPPGRVALAKALVMKARILHALGRNDESRVAGERLVAELADDDNAELAVVLGGYAGLLTTMLGEHDQAEPLYERALAADPANAYVLNDYALFLTDTRGEHHRAQELYERALAVNPGNATFLGNYANFLTDALGDHDRAQDAYERALAADPTNATVLGDYANFLTDVRGDHDRAQELYERATSLAPADTTTLHNYAIFLSDVRGDYGRADELYARVIGADPTNTAALNNYANLLVDGRGDHAQVQELFERAIAVDPTNATILGNYARLLFEQHKDAQATDYAQRAFENAGDDDDDLRAELFIYLCAVGPPTERADAEANLRALLDSGVRSPGWDLSRILARARAEDPSRSPHLDELAGELTSSPSDPGDG